MPNPVHRVSGGDEWMAKMQVGVNLWHITLFRCINKKNRQESASIPNLEADMEEKQALHLGRIHGDIVIRELHALVTCRMSLDLDVCLTSHITKLRKCFKHGRLPPRFHAQQPHLHFLETLLKHKLPDKPRYQSVPRLQSFL